MKHIKYTLTLAALVAASSLATWGATPEQMEKAKAAAYKACLRNMNNGSDYLDKLKPGSVSELEGKLKSKEKENIAKLKGVRIPDESEYASWDKAQFDKYWSETFVKATPVTTKGFCTTQVKSAISGISVTKQEVKPKTQTAPEGVQAPKPEPAAAPQAPQPAAPSTPEAAEPEVEDVAVESEDVQQGEMAPVPTEAVTPAPVEAPKKKDSNTASIVVLCILVLVVVALVGYALNVMKKNKARQSGRPRSARRAEADYADYDTPAATVQSDPEEESPFAAYSGFQEPAPSVPDPRDREIERLRSEIASLQSQMRKRQSAPAGLAGGPVRTPRIIYLAQANADGVFTRADARYNMGNSIFKLVTTDGVSGSFSVIEDPTVFELALMMPTDFLVNACAGRNLQLSEGARAIVNEASGTAIFEDGRWRVSRKAQIRYSR